MRFEMETVFRLKHHYQQHLRLNSAVFHHLCGFNLPSNIDEFVNSHLNEYITVFNALFWYKVLHLVHLSTGRSCSAPISKCARDSQASKGLLALFSCMSQPGASKYRDEFFVLQFCLHRQAIKIGLMKTMT